MVMSRFCSGLGPSVFTPVWPAEGFRPPWVSFQTWLAMTSWFNARNWICGAKSTRRPGRMIGSPVFGSSDLGEGLLGGVDVRPVGQRVAVEVVHPAAVVVGGHVGGQVHCGRVARPFFLEGVHCPDDHAQQVLLLPQAEDRAHVGGAIQHQAGAVEEDRLLGDGDAQLPLDGGGRLDVLFAEADVVQGVHFLGLDEVLARVAGHGHAGDPLAVEAGGHGRHEPAGDELLGREGGQDAVDEQLAGDAGKGRGIDRAHGFLQGAAVGRIEILLHEAVPHGLAVAAEDGVRGQVAEREG